MASPTPPPPRDPRGRAGCDGERAAAEHLARLGWRLLARNARTRHGEIDLICLAGRTLVFVEVKALRGAGVPAAERSLESISERKRRRIRRLARAWLADHAPPLAYGEIRFDAVGVSVGGDGRPNGLVHVPAAF